MKSVEREFEPAVKINGYEKHFKSFDLGPVYLDIPKGFVTAVIGENGAGKSTLLEMLGGITSVNEGTVTWLGKYTDLDQDNARNEIGWCAGNRFFPEGWSIQNVKKSLALAFNNFDLKKFESLCEKFNLTNDSDDPKNKKKIAQYSDGNKSRLAIASVMARDTKLLIMDEPDSALDPVIRDTLCSKFRQYINEGNGETSILFSTHNVADMANVVDYVVYFSNGKVTGKGFVEDLLEQYKYVHGPKNLLNKYRPYLESYFASEENTYFEGLCTQEDSEVFEQDEDIAVEKPTLQQLSIMFLRKHA